MSNGGGNGQQPDRDALKRLEGVVKKALAGLEEARRRAEAAEAKGVELETLVKRFTEDAGEPVRLLSKLESLEAENTDLRARVQLGSEGVQRLLAKIRFLEEQR